MNKTKKADLRLAIISDPHLGFTGHINPNYYGLGQPGDQDKWFEYALRYFSSRGIDALVIPGDMANACAYGRAGVTSADCAAAEMIRLGKIFRDVFGESETKLIAIYGNHDNLVQPRERLNGGDGSPWEDAFGEPYTHVFEKTVKGYTFIGANWGYEKEAREAVARAAEGEMGKPVFYIQHGEIKGTTCDTLEGNISSVGIDNVRDFDNVIAMFGHTHCPITNERTIWQSEKAGDPKCTVLSCGTFNYADTVGDLVRGENLMTKHALYLTVSGMEINIERLSFWTDEMLMLAKGEKTEQDFKLCTKSAGQDWHFTLGGERIYDTARRTAEGAAPEFPEGAVAGLSRSDDYAVIFFPAAIPPERDGDVLHSYYAEATDGEGRVVSFGQICTEYHVDRSADYFSPYYQIVLTGLTPNTEYTFRVFARDCFGNMSKNPIIHIGKTLAKKGSRLA